MSNGNNPIGYEDIVDLIDFLSPSEEDIARWRAADEIAAADDEYYAPRKETILVPVEVEYHYATNIVYRFKPPTREDIENALRNRHL